MADELQRRLRRQRADLLRIERAAASDMVRAYKQVADRLARDLRALTDQIDHARAAGIEVRPGWLYSQERYRALLGQLNEHTLTFLHRSLASVTNAQQLSLALVEPHARDLILGALGPAPARVVAEFAPRFDRLPTLALDKLIGRASNGMPLGQLLMEVGGDQVEQVKNALHYGVAAGRPVRTIARDVQRASGTSLVRALNISRTEVLGAYRAAASDRFTQSPVVTGWYWECFVDERTCAACLAEQGSVHDSSEVMATHPSCRCAQVPITRSWADLGFTSVPDSRPPILTGDELFARMPEPTRLAIVGRAKLDAYNAGRISLQDMVHHTHSPRWGPGIREASLQQALAVHA